MSPKVDRVRFQCAGFCCGCRNEELKLWAPYHTMEQRWHFVLAMLVLAMREMVAKPHLSLKRPSGCVGSLMPPPASLPARGPAHRRSTAFPCGDRARVATLFLFLQARTKAGTSSTTQEPSTPSLCICLKSGKYLKYGRGKGGV